LPADASLPARVRADGAGILLFLRVQPGARREGVEGVATEADGTARLKVALSAAPEGGKANARLIALLARRWKLPKGAFSISAGERDRRKTMLIMGDAATILARIFDDCRTAEAKGQ
jgi:uncharacterized protein (TIGR00251 family)